MTYRRLMGIAVVVAASVASAKVMLAQEPARGKASEKAAAPKDVNRPVAAAATVAAEAPKGTIIAGMFDGTFSVGRTRAVAGRNQAALVLAHISPDGRTNWMESFDGLAPGRAVASVQLPGGGAVVAGVFQGKFKLNVPKQKEFNSGDADGLFVAVVTPWGRVTLARTLGVAGHFAAPNLSYSAEKFTLEVPYRGTLSQVPFKPFPTPKPGPGILRLTASRDGKVLSAEIVKTLKGADNTNPASPGGELHQAPGAPAAVTGKAKVAAGTPVPAPPPLPAGTTALSVMAAQNTCNVCVLDVPQTSGACQDCRQHVCNDDSDIWCCDSGWDRQCMNEAMSGTCPAPQNVCECPHPTGQPGVWMHHQCQSPGHPRCAHDVCSDDDFCTSTWWDDRCVGEGNAECGGA